METDRSNGGRKMSGTPDNTPGEPKEIFSLPARQKRNPFPEFPAKMLVAIDGWAEVEKAGMGGGSQQPWAECWWTPGNFTTLSLEPAKKAAWILRLPQRLRTSAGA
jgi:hypothetical protein